MRFKMVTFSCEIWVGVAYQRGGVEK